MDAYMHLTMARQGPLVKVESRIVKAQEEIDEAIDRLEDADGLLFRVARTVLYDAPRPVWPCLHLGRYIVPQHLLWWGTMYYIEGEDQ